VNTETLKKAYDGFGKFRPMTLDEAKALPHHARIWLRMGDCVQQFQTYDSGIDQYKRFRRDIDIGCITEKSILDGQVLVEIAEAQ
jgi:hypothetical protein